MLKFDYHNHPQAHREDLHYREEVLQPWADKARAIGITDFALTDHDRYKAGFSFDELKKFQYNNSDLKIRAGIELDNDPETSDSGKKWVEKHYDDLDFVLGSVHFVKDFPFDHPYYIKEYDNYDIDELYTEYYKLIQKTAKSGLVDSLAHLDLIKIFKFFPETDLSALYEETLDIIKAQDLSMEISTAGFRKPIGEQYPHFDLIKLAKAKGISFTIASDAHTAADLGKNYDLLENILKEFEIEEVATYEKHKKIMASPYL
ncbi:MAG: histidinol-phosphatase HisJ family protein [Candidatus Caenarcaniphilales bacterium]|nr:histidinol-phosphatase HisJ family protein [Candidatus Caenarcaniphilales bacterium]